MSVCLSLPLNHGLAVLLLDETPKNIFVIITRGYVFSTVICGRIFLSVMTKISQKAATRPIKKETR